LIGILALASCASAPKTPVQDDFISSSFTALDSGGLVYLWADISGARPILDQSQFAGFNGKRTADLLDRTAFVAAAVYPPETGKRFMVSAQGRYPSFWAGMSFAFSLSWKKRRSETGGRYWYSARENLSVFLNPRDALVSDGDPFSQGSGPELPAVFGDMSPGAVLAGWITSVAEPLNRFIAKLNIPIQIPADQAVFALYPAEEGKYEAALRLETPTVSQSQALASMLSMLRVFLPPDSSGADPASPLALLAALLANPPAVEGTALILRSRALESGSIALLFNAFSLYSH
jgi:hypothetical protein